MIGMNGVENKETVKPAVTGAVGGTMPRENLIEIIWRRIWVVFLTVLVCLAGALIYIYKATPIYTSESRIYVEQKGPAIISQQQGFMTQSKNYLYTQCGLLKSNPILSVVLDKPEIAHMKTFMDVDYPLAYLKKELVARPGKKDDIITVSFDSPYRKEASQLVNAIVESYVAYHAKKQKTTAAEVLQILQQEKVKRDQDLKGLYRKLLTFKETNPLISMKDEGGSIVLQELSRLSQALSDARLETINTKAIYESARQMTDDPEQLRQLVEAQTMRAGYYASNSDVAQMRVMLERYQLEIAGSLKSPEHPQIKAMQSKVKQLQEQLQRREREKAAAYVEVLRQQWLASKEKETEVQRAYDQQKQMAQELNSKATELAILDSEIKRTERMLDIIDTRIKELAVTEDTGALNISVLEFARPAEKPTYPRKVRIVSVMLVLGFFLGIGFALLLDMKDYRLRSVDEITALLQIPVLGKIPSMKGKLSVTQRGRKVHLEPTSIIAEAYKTLRTAVYFGAPKGKSRTILVTSPTPGDGKSTLVSNLALAMAQSQQKVLIMDGDFRKPVQHKIFELEQEPGIADVLTGQARIDDVLHANLVENLDLMTCGPIPVNPSEMLNSDAFREMLDELIGRYDRILVDSPPVMPVTDARILGAMCDITLLVVRAEKSTRRACQEARDGLLSVKANLIGVVVNDIQAHRGRYGYYSEYGYEKAYRRYSRSPEEEKSEKKESAKR